MLFSVLEKYLDRKTRCRLRATCKEVKYYVQKPKSLRHLALKLDTSVKSKIDMVLAASKVRCVKQFEHFDDVEIYIGYQKIGCLFITRMFYRATEDDVLYFLRQKFIKFDRVATQNETLFEFLF